MTTSRSFHTELPCARNLQAFRFHPKLLVPRTDLGLPMGPLVQSLLPLSPTLSNCNRLFHSLRRGTWCWERQPNHRDGAQSWVWFPPQVLLENMEANCVWGNRDSFHCFALLIHSPRYFAAWRNSGSAYEYLLVIQFSYKKDISWMFYPRILYLHTITQPAIIFNINCKLVTE